MRERHERVLAEMAEAGMVVVRRLSAAMEAAEDLPTQVQIGLAYHRVSRAVRQTIALEFRLAQGVDRAARDPVTPRPTTSAPNTPPRPRTESASWNEYERDDSDEALEALDVLLDADGADPEEIHAAVETCITRIRQDLDVTLPTASKPRLSSPAGGGGPPDGWWRGNGSSSACPIGPLHPAAQGPPPPTGEEIRGLNPIARRSALLSGAATFPRPPPNLRLSPT